MSILVLGGSGRLGKVLKEVLRDDGYYVKAPPSNEYDLRKESIKSKILKDRPSLIINTAAVSNVDRCEKEPELAYGINVEGTERLVEVSGVLDIPLIYVSTDYVFDGENPPYFEDDDRKPVNVYGKTKMLGEDRVRELEKYVILRVSWLFGPEKKDFVDFVLSREEDIPVVKEQVSKPTCTTEVSRAIEKIIMSGKYGVYHFANKPASTRKEWVEAILSISGKNVKMKEMKWKQLGVTAERPFNTSLDTGKYERECGKIRKWESCLKELIDGKDV